MEHGKRKKIVVMKNFISKYVYECIWIPSCQTSLSRLDLYHIWDCSLLCIYEGKPLKKGGGGVKSGVFHTKKNWMPFLGPLRAI